MRTAEAQFLLKANFHLSYSGEVASLRVSPFEFVSSHFTTEKTSQTSLLLFLNTSFYICAEKKTNLEFADNALLPVSTGAAEAPPKTAARWGPK